MIPQQQALVFIYFRRDAPISHSLSLECAYEGRVNKFYCKESTMVTVKI